MKDYYSILGVDRNATGDEIKKAYRRLSMQYHPDKNQGDKGAEDKFKEISEAYDAIKTGKADNINTDGFSRTGWGFSGSDFEFNFADMFSRSNSNRTRKRGSDIRVQLKLDLSAVLNGINKTIRYKRHDKCSPCNGLGGDFKKCVACGGSGRQTIIIDNFYRADTTCMHCLGNGGKVHNPCNTCGGQKVVEQSVEVNISVPRGGHLNNITIKDGGNYGEAGYGYLLVILLVDLSDSGFDFVKGSKTDIETRVHIPYTSFILGGEHELDMVGNKIKYTVPPNSKTNQIIEIIGSGIPVNGRLGKLNIILDVMFPPNTDEVILATKKYKEELNY